MFIDNDGRIAGNIAGDFFLSFLIDKAYKNPDINVLATGHRGFNDAKKCFYRSGNIGFVNASFVSDLVNNVCFGHGDFVLREIKIQGGKFKRRTVKRKMKSLIIKFLPAKVLIKSVAKMVFRVMKYWKVIN
jgi:hypothetical protein